MNSGDNTIRTLMEKLSLNIRRRTLILMAMDAFSITIAYLAGFLLRYPVNDWSELVWEALFYLPIFIPLGLSIFIIMKMYRTLWRYASVEAVFIIGFGTLAAVIVPAALLIFARGMVFHWSVFVIQWMVLLVIVSLGRFSIRVVRSLGTSNSRNGRKRILIYGAGDAGEMICRDLQRNRYHNFHLIGFIDDDKNKHGQSIHNIKILGGLDQVELIVAQQRIDEIVVAMPSLPGDQVRKLLEFVRNKIDRRVKLATVPGISELIDGVVTFQQVRQFRIRDLLRRTPVELSTEPVENLIRGKSILISGAGGSIGAEICRQAAIFSPAKVIMFDISEASLYTINEEMTEKFGDVQLIPIVGDICNSAIVEQVFQEHNPDIVFHAAAYKHVPMMEKNPWSAISNNVRGTRTLSNISADYKVEKFVMISTDKAVRPASIMGATKRLCEMLVQAQNRDKDSVFSMVRFGNVMGSSGSVIPKFDRQIKAGGPVTVTDRQTTRFFMLTSEAVQLVMQSATLNDDNAIYILNMGEPVKIVDLAHDMIRLSGLEPNIDIKIEFTGLQKGEKLHEELYHYGAGEDTTIENIWVSRTSAPLPLQFMERVENMIENCFLYTHEELYLKVQELVPDFSGIRAANRKGSRNRKSGLQRKSISELKSA